MGAKQFIGSIMTDISQNKEQTSFKYVSDAFIFIEIVRLETPVNIPASAQNQPSSGT